jgi:hypothetical protein
MLRENIDADRSNFSGKLMNRFPKLHESDPILTKGKKEEMIEKICLRLNKSGKAFFILIVTL